MRDVRVAPSLEVACLLCGAEPGTPCHVIGGGLESFHIPRFRMAQVYAHAQEARTIAKNMSHEPMAHAIIELCQALTLLAGAKS